MPQRPRLLRPCCCYGCMGSSGWAARAAAAWWHTGAAAVVWCVDAGAGQLNAAASLWCQRSPAPHGKCVADSSGAASRLSCRRHGGGMVGRLCNGSGIWRRCVRHVGAMCTSHGAPQSALGPSQAGSLGYRGSSSAGHARAWPAGLGRPKSCLSPQPAVSALPAARCRPAAPCVHTISPCCAALHPNCTAEVRAAGPARAQDPRHPPPPHQGPGQPKRLRRPALGLTAACLFVLHLVCLTRRPSMPPLLCSTCATCFFVQANATTEKAAKKARAFPQRKFAVKA